MTIEAYKSGPDVVLVLDETSAQRLLEITYEQADDLMSSAGSHKSMRNEANFLFSIASALRGALAK